MFKIIGADQRTYGPASADQVRQWVTEGRADARTLVQEEGGTDWRPLASFAEFSALFPAETSPEVQPPAARGAVPTSGWSTPVASRPEIPTYLPQSILVTLCCCLPFGIPAIVYAAQVSQRLNSGDVEGAQTASRKARLWFWIAFGLGVLATLIQLIVMALVTEGDWLRKHW